MLLHTNGRIIRAAGWELNLYLFAHSIHHVLRYTFLSHFPIFREFASFLRHVSPFTDWWQVKEQEHFILFSPHAVLIRCHMKITRMITLCGNRTENSHWVLFS